MKFESSSQTTEHAHEKSVLTVISLTRLLTIACEPAGVIEQASMTMSRANTDNQYRVKTRYGRFDPSKGYIVAGHGSYVSSTSAG